MLGLKYSKIKKFYILLKLIHKKRNSLNKVLKKIYRASSIEMPLSNVSCRSLEPNKLLAYQTSKSERPIQVFVYFVIFLIIHLETYIHRH